MLNPNIEETDENREVLQDTGKEHRGVIVLHFLIVVNYI